MFKFGCRLPSCFRSIVVVEKNFKRYLSNEVAHQRFFEKRSQIINGKAISSKILSDLKCDIDDWINLGNRRPQLTAVVVGDHPASITADIVRCPKTISQRELLNIINDLNSDDIVDAILVQLPCPPHINEKNVFNTINVSKDVDGFNSVNIANLTLHEPGIVPCTALAVNSIIQELDIPEISLEAVVVGCSRYIGLPIFLTLRNYHNLGNVSKHSRNITLTLCNEYTPKSTLFHCLQRSDIIISAVGKPGVIKGDSIKPGAIVIDVGITMMSESKGEKQKFVGDVEFEKARDIASYITPVPGGVGPVTVAMLMANTFHCAVIRKNRKMELDQANSMTED
ncbi:bifunctional methylenetetrahydrofolate dehydrogenase/cyclohydrolase, mitochondrial isoform X2 [Halyomorpha halys]|uniref:bifunctional methylenetetrahydrofolate dehydrogenase/cyclohydrolase, mitochondrial isoform X2 n=1 Tax=Halyomorpha halys TaxID=286706 RepID=UPI000D0C84BC|nr:bifunctional methylenetetrahydrofolate dehydrogenase/cyclohydrolase, mitochondrial isoform X2 [Halyomorpha halys]